MGFGWLILAVVIYLNEGASLQYYITIILAFLALFTGTILFRIKQVKDDILKEIRKEKIK